MFINIWWDLYRLYKDPMWEYGCNFGMLVEIYHANLLINFENVGYLIKTSLHLFAIWEIRETEGSSKAGGSKFHGSMDVDRCMNHPGMMGQQLP